MKSRWRLLLAASLLFGALLRLWALDADPPLFLNLDYIGDEGGWALNARHKLIHGLWICDQFNLPIFAAPLHTLLLYGLFRIAGMTIWSLRVSAGLAGLLSMLLFWHYVRRAWDLTPTTIATALFSLNQLHVGYSRVGMVESLQLAPLLLVMIGFGYPGPWAAFGAGICLGLSFLVKSSAAQFAPAVALLFLAGILGGRRQWRDAGWILAGTAVVIGPYFFSLGAHSGGWLYANTQSGYSCLTLHGLPVFLGSTAFLWMLIPALAGLVGLVSAFPFRWAMLRDFCANRPLEADAAAVVLGAGLGIAMNGYQPERRFLMLVAPLIVLATAAWHRLSTGGSGFRLGWLGGFLGALFLLRQAETGVAQWLLIFRQEQYIPPPHVFRMELFAALGLALLARQWRISRRVAHGALLAAFAAEFALLLSWFPHISYHQRAAFQEIAGLPANGWMAGPVTVATAALGYSGCLLLIHPSANLSVDLRDSYYGFYLTYVQRDYLHYPDHSFQALLPWVTPRLQAPQDARVVKRLVIAKGEGGRMRVEDVLLETPHVPGRDPACCSGPH